MTSQEVVLTGKVGIASDLDTAVVQARFTREHALVVQQLLSPKAESARYKKTFVASNAVGGVDHGSSLSTAPPIALWNPPGSGKRLIIDLVTLGYVSGTLGAGFLAIAKSAQATTPSGGTELTPVSTSLGGTNDRAGRAFTGSTITTAGAIVRPSVTIQPMLATTAGQPGLVSDPVEGAIQVEPGNLFILEGVCGAAGTSPKVVLSITWTEVDL